MALNEDKIENVIRNLLERSRKQNNEYLLFGNLYVYVRDNLPGHMGSFFGRCVVQPVGLASELTLAGMPPMVADSVDAKRKHRECFGQLKA